jgi:hypothetical protein
LVATLVIGEVLIFTWSMPDFILETSQGGGPPSLRVWRRKSEEPQRKLSETIADGNWRFGQISNSNGDQESNADLDRYDAKVAFELSAAID